MNWQACQPIFHPSAFGFHCPADRGKIYLELPSQTNEPQAEESHLHSLCLPPAAPWERALLSATAFSWGIGILGTAQMGHWGHSSYSVSPHPKSPWRGMRCPCHVQSKANVSLSHCDASAPSQTQPCCPWHVSFPQQKTNDRKTLGLLWALLLCPG